MNLTRGHNSTSHHAKASLPNLFQAQSSSTCSGPREGRALVLDADWWPRDGAICHHVLPLTPALPGPESSHALCPPGSNTSHLAALR